MKARWIWRAVKIALFAGAALSVVSYAVMSLWNALLPGIFGAKAITFWQALGLLVLSKLLFGGFRPGYGGGPWRRRRLMERWQKMTPEERERFKQGMRRGCAQRGGREDMSGTQSEVRA